ncbi:MAG: efflux transporter periplasmic adaptor subunit, partial [Xanthomonadales bacterium]|nr:efflux transporter periplasmic adaptor subunit [Xanthomonadales bacterium]
MKQKLKRALLIGVILVVAVGIAGLLGQMKPPPEKKDAPTLDPLVEVQRLELESVSFVIESQGTVRPRTRTEL